MLDTEISSALKVLVTAMNLNETVSFGLKRCGRAKYHQDQTCDRTAGAQHCDGSIREDKSSGNICVWHTCGEGWPNRVCFKSQCCKTHGCRAEPWDSLKGMSIFAAFEKVGCAPTNQASPPIMYPGRAWTGDAAIALL